MITDIIREVETTRYSEPSTTISDSPSRIESMDTQVSTESFFKVLNGPCGRITMKILNLSIYLASSRLINESEFLNLLMDKSVKLFKILMSFIDESMSLTDLATIYEFIESIYHIFLAYLKSRQQVKDIKLPVIKQMYMLTIEMLPILSSMSILQRQAHQPLYDLQKLEPPI